MDNWQAIWPKKFINQFTIYKAIYEMKLQNETDAIIKLCKVWDELTDLCKMTDGLIRL